MNSEFATRPTPICRIWHQTNSVLTRQMWGKCKLNKFIFWTPDLENDNTYSSLGSIGSWKNLFITGIINFYMHTKSRCWFFPSLKTMLNSMKLYYSTYPGFFVINLHQILSNHLSIIWKFFNETFFVPLTYFKIECRTAKNKKRQQFHSENLTWNKLEIP